VTLRILRIQLESEVKAEEIGSSSETPLKAIVVREALLWRIVELADGVVQCLETGNNLSAVILARATLECSAVQHQLNQKIRGAKTLGVAALDDEIMKLLLGTRTFSTGDKVEDAKIQMTNIQTCLRKLDNEFSGVYKDYGFLCEFAHPNWAGVTGLFSEGDLGEGVIKLGRDVRGGQQTLLDLTTSITTSALVMFSSDYISIADHLQDFIDACE
jgi:hypothetical protein